jgi:hypothetical protein
MSRLACPDEVVRGDRAKKPLIAREVSAQRGMLAMPPNEPCPHCGVLIMDWHNEWYEGAQRRAIYSGQAAMDCPLCRQAVFWFQSRDRSAADECPSAGLSALGNHSRSMGSHSRACLWQSGGLHRQSSGGATVCRLLAAWRSPTGRSTGEQTMILTREEISFLDVYCHEGTERPFGGPATNVMTSIGVHNADTLNLQWAYLRDKPPSGPMVGNASKITPPLPWANREAVVRRDAEIRAIREALQRTQSSSLVRQKEGVDDSREAISKDDAIA